MTKIISDDELAKTIGERGAADLDSLFSGHVDEYRALLKAQRDSSDRETLRDLEGILNDAGDLRTLERQLVGYVAILNLEVKE